jgi:RNA polymerase sigma-70 factor (ECF subfamily)
MIIETPIMQKKVVLDKPALIKIYDQYSTVLFRYAYSSLGDKDIAEECVSETFSRFLESLARKPEGPNNVRAYLYRIAHNWISDHYRSRSSEHDSLDSELYIDPNGTAELIAGQQQERAKLRWAIKQLPQDQQQVITLRFIEELSHEDTAQIMNKTIGASRALQYRALNSLRTILTENNNGRKPNARK